VKPLKIGVVTLFPEAFGFLEDKDQSGLIGKAFTEKKIELFKCDLREFGEGKHKVVDDMPFGGGDGMVLKPAPLQAAIDALVSRMGSAVQKTKVVFLTPAGKLWTQSRAESLADELQVNEDAIVLVCGRYAGFDQRLIEHYGGCEVSIGPFVLNGGELPALCVIESLVRLLPGVLGNSESVLVDSFSKGTEGRIEAFSYTRPQDWKGVQVPSELIGGNHKVVEAYRDQVSEQRTKKWMEDTKKALFPSE